MLRLTAAFKRWLIFIIVSIRGSIFIRLSFRAAPDTVILRERLESTAAEEEEEDILRIVGGAKRANKRSRLVGCSLVCFPN
jgi:hypothetical protein